MYPTRLSSDNSIPFIQDDGGFYFLLVSPPAVVESVLDMAALRPGDVLYDLGSGDGRIVIAAARRYGVHAVGIENHGDLYRHSLEAAHEAGVEHLVSFRREDFAGACLPDADVVVIYHEDGALSRPSLLSRLQEVRRRGGRVIVIGEPAAAWEATDRREVTDAGGNLYPIYLYAGYPADMHSE